MCSLQSYLKELSLFFIHKGHSNFFLLRLQCEILMHIILVILEGKLLLKAFFFFEKLGTEILAYY